MALKDLYIKRHYRTNKDNVVKELLVPVLQESYIYNRAVGYFTLDALLNYAEGLVGFLRNNGVMRLVVSPMLIESDVETIQKGFEISDSIVLERIIEQLIDIKNIKDKAKMDIIANLISVEKLKIKIAYCATGLYHEKIGYLEDSNSDYIAFNGSMNETFSALYKNIETISVFKSWIEGANEYANEINVQFKDLWNNRAEGIKVFNFPEAVKEVLINKYKTSFDLETAIENYLIAEQSEQDFEGEEFSSEEYESKTLYDYQNLAIKEFVDNNYTHFFEMATGTGKTFTAINALKKLMEEKEKVFIIVLVPQIDLQTQWFYELNQMGIEDVHGIGGGANSSSWEYDFNSSVIEYTVNNKSVIYVAVYDSFFDKLVNKIKNVLNLTIIVDEAHNLSVNQMKKMPMNALYRLGLSATPEKHKSEETEQILKYFIGSNRNTFKYTIEEAIKNGFLSKYVYYPMFVELLPDEFEKYIAMSKKVAILQNQDKKDYDAISRALNERSLIVKKAENKIYKLEQMINDGYNFYNSVVYCGQGKFAETEESMVDIVTRILDAKGKGKYSVSTFTSKTPNRKVVLEEFKKGFFDVLVAIKCFDEGVDVPQLDKIYIMSSDRLVRQTIQRRGRVLRKCRESGKQLAYIYDMVVLPPPGSDDKLSGKNLIKNEFLRVKEYMRLAENKEQFEKQIKVIEENYSITEEDYYNEEESN